MSASKEETNGNDEPIAASGANGSEAQILGTSDERGPCKDEGSGARDHLEIPKSVDPEGEVRASHVNDPEQDQDSKVPPCRNC